MSSERSTDYVNWVSIALSGTTGLAAHELHSVISQLGDSGYFRCEEAPNGKTYIASAGDCTLKLVLTEKARQAALAHIEGKYMGGNAESFHAAMSSLERDRD